jgi:hypothetical protein
MKAGLAWSVLLSGCALQPLEPVISMSAEVALHLGIAQTGHGMEAVYRLCADCPAPTRKVLAPMAPPIRLAEAPKAQSAPVPQPKEERITRAVHFSFASSKLTAEARRTLDALRPLLLEARSIGLSGHTDRVGAPAFNRKLAARRAETVKRALLDLGVARERIVRVESACCVEDPPRVNPPARRTDVEMLIVRTTR